MLRASATFAAFEQAGVSLHTGVPDSLLKDYIAYVEEYSSRPTHVVAASEGGAIAIATGHYLATEDPAVVYLQNSGLGNALNPLMSLADHRVYGIPMVLLIGWRGEPGRPDEPQHIGQGVATIPTLEATSIPWSLMPTDEEGATKLISSAVTAAVDESRPHALLVRKGAFAPYSPSRPPSVDALLAREEAIVAVAAAVEADGVTVATTGKTSRELHEYRNRSGEPHHRDFLTVGSMGHASQIALGISIAQPDRPVWVLDGDGALVMHLGGMATIAEHGPPRFRHIVLNNRVHDSVGGQATPTSLLSTPDLAIAAGYRYAACADRLDDVRRELEYVKGIEGPSLLEIVVRPGSRSDLGRPSTTPQENKALIREYLGT